MENLNEKNWGKIRNQIDVQKSIDIANLETRLTEENEKLEKFKYKKKDDEYFKIINEIKDIGDKIKNLGGGIDKEEEKKENEEITLKPNEIKEGTLNSLKKIYGKERII